MKIIHIHALGPNPDVGSIFICQFNGVVCFIVYSQLRDVAKITPNFLFVGGERKKYSFWIKKQTNVCLFRFFRLLCSGKNF